MLFRSIPCYAVKINYNGKIVAYVTDSTYNESLIDFVRDGDLLICGATICKGSSHSTGEGHMDARQAGTIARKAKVKDMVLTHLPHDGDFELMKNEASEAFGREVYLPNIKGTFLL